jgi:putative transposase
MSNYIRCYRPGGCYFFTVVTHHRRPLFTNKNHVALLKSAFKKVKQKFPFAMNAFVILPDHLHCLWKLPENDSDYSTRWRLIKRYFSMEFDKKCNSRGEKEIWQRRFWEHTIVNEKDWRNHMNYIHYNPVKHGYAQAPKDWPESSFLYWVEKGFYEKNWRVL